MTLPFLLLEMGLLQRGEGRRLAFGYAKAALRQPSAWSALFHVYQRLVFMQT